MSDEPTDEFDNKPNFGNTIREIPTKPDELLAGMELQMKIFRAVPEHAATIAAARRALFLQYVRSGFTDAQAMELCKGSLL